MTGYNYSYQGNNRIIKSLIIGLFIFCGSVLYGQSPVNFSGSWIQDTVKSDDFYKAFDVRCAISQNTQTIVIKLTFFEKTGKEITSREDSFSLDGKEVSKEEQGGINKESAKWSPDKKSLTTTSTRTVGNDVYGSSSVYSLSANGQVMTVVTSDINPGGLSVKQIFNKKQ
jgi:hypothetical protein